MENYIVHWFVGNRARYEVIQGLDKVADFILDKNNVKIFIHGTGIQISLDEVSGR